MHMAAATRKSCIRAASAALAYGMVAVLGSLLLLFGGGREHRRPALP